MEITLRKAHALSKTLQMEASKIHLSKTASISIYQEETIEESIAKAADLLRANVERVTDLIAAQFAIRDALASANADCGVNDLLTEKAGVAAMLKILQPLAEPSSGVDEAQAKNILEARKAKAARSDSDYYGSDTFEVDLVRPEGIQDQLRNMRKRIVAIDDELLALNTSKTISLPDDVVDILTKAELV